MRIKMGLFVVYDGETVEEAMQSHYDGYKSEKDIFADAIADLEDNVCFSVFSKLTAESELVLIGNYQVIDGKVVKQERPV